MPYRSPSESRSRASSLALVVGLHGAAIAAALLAKSGYVPTIIDEPIRTVWIEPVEDPPPLPPPEPRTESVRPTESLVTIPNRDRVERPVLPPVDDFVWAPPPRPSPPVRRDPPPPPPPVLIDARFTSSALSRLQPPYPSALLRAEIEGEVTVRVTIGPDGRVKRVDKIRADHDAFFAATERHALRAWRFEPATRDGRPIESSQVHTVRFEITG